MKKSILKSGLPYSILREIKRSFRERETIVLTFILPVVISIILLSIYGDGSVRKLPVAIFDEDRSELSSTMKLAVQSSSAMNVVLHASSMEEIKNAFRTGKIQGAFYFPYRMESDLKKNRQVYPVLLKNSHNIISGSFLLKEGQTIFRTFNGGILLKKLRSKGLSEQQAMETIKPVSVDATVLYNASFNYKFFLSPGIIFAQLQLFFMIAGLLTITREIDKRSFRAALQISNKSIWTVFLSKIIVLVLWATFTISIITGILFRISGIHIFNYPVFLAVCILYITASVTIGFCLGVILRNTLLSAEIAIFLSMPAFMLSGYTFPQWAIPDFLVAISNILPFTHFYTAYFKISQMNAPLNYAFSEINNIFIIILISLLVTLTISYFNIKSFTAKSKQKNFQNTQLQKYPRNLAGMIKRELDIIATNPCLLMILFGGPLVYPFLYNSIYYQKMQRDIPVSVVDFDQSEYSRKLISDLDAHELVHVAFKEHNIEEAHNHLKSLRSMAVIIIPKGFEADQKKFKQSRIHTSINNTRFLVASDINKALGDVVSNYSSYRVQCFFEKAGIGRKQASILSEPIHLNTNNCFNTTDSYGDSLIAALFIVILSQSLLIGMALSMAAEREDKRIAELMTSSRSSALRIFTGKGLFYIFLYISYSALFFTIHSSIYKVPFNGSYFTLFISLTLLFVSVIAMSLFFSTFFKSRFMALLVFMVSSYPLFLMSGYAWPLESLPPVLQKLTQIFPSTPFFQAYVVCTKMGGTLSDIKTQIIQISILSIIYYIFFAVRIGQLKRSNLSTDLS